MRRSLYVFAAIAVLPGCSESVVTWSDVVRRDGRQQTLTGSVVLAEQVTYGIIADPSASAKAVRIRNGILKGTTEGTSTATK